MPNPLGEALAEEILAHVRGVLAVEDPDYRCGLTPVVAPTGSGKTTAAVTMFADLLEGGVDGKLVYATANIVDRDAFAAKLRAELKRRAAADCFSVYVAESNIDSIMKRAAAAKSPANPLDLPAAGLENEIVRERAAALGAKIRRYDEMRRAGIDKDAAFADLNKRTLDEIRDSEGEMRKAIRNALRDEVSEYSKLIECEVDVAEYAAESPKWSWLYDFYPQTRYIGADVVVTTHAKLLYPIDTVVSDGATLIDPACLYDVAVLVVDEGDAFAGTVRQQIIRDACRGSIDLFELIGATDMILQETKPGNRSYLRSVLSKSILDDLDRQHRVIHEIAEEFNLGVKSKYVGVSGDRGFIFTGGGTYVDGFPSKGEDRHLAVSNGDAVNVITRRDADRSGEDDAELGYRVIRCGAVIRSYARALAWAARDMVRNERKGEEKAGKGWIGVEVDEGEGNGSAVEHKETDFTSKLWSLVSHLRLPNPRYYVDMAQAERYSVGPMREKLRGYLGPDDTSFYARGFLLTKLVDSRQHESYTGVDLRAVRLTPEMILAGMSSAALVVAMSATMETKTAANFDMGYMAEALGELYRVLAPERLQRIKRLADEKNARIAETVLPQVAVIGAVGMEAAKTAAGGLSGFERYFDLCAAQRFGVKGSLFYSDEGKRGDYQERRAALMACAYRLFRRSMDETDARSMLCFLGKKVNGAALDDFLRLIEQLEREGGWRTPPPKVLSIDARSWEAMYEGNGRRLLESGGAAFILTTYPTAAIAKNMQYACPDAQSGLVRIFEDGTGMKDIDCLYFGRPSGLLPSSPDAVEGEEGAEELRMTRLYMEAAYYERGEVSFKDHRLRVRRELEGRGRENKFRDFPSYRAAMARVVSQGSGRVERTGLRCARPLVVLDDDVARYLDTAAYAGQPTGYIYSAVVEKCREVQGGAGSTASIEENRAAHCNDSAARNIRRLCESGGWTDGKRSVYERWRDACLMHPTLSEEDALELGAFSGRWVVLPQPAASLSYSVEEGASNLKGAEISLHGPAQGAPDRIVSEVSCEKSGMTILTRAPFFAEHCARKGIPTTWEPHCRILPPAAFVNFYKGALGEEFVYAFFADLAAELGVENPLHPIDDLAAYEKFDFCAGGGIYIDAKNWNREVGGGGTEKAQVEKALRKLKDVDGKTAVYIQTIDWSAVPGADPAYANQIVDERYDGGLRVVRVPGLISPAGLRMQAAVDCLKELVFHE